MSRLSVFAAILLVCLATASVRAAAPTASMIAEWVEQLGSQQFATREAASRNLTAAGIDAVGPLAAAASRSDLEISSRAIEILGGFLPAEDPGLAQSAETAIESLVDGPEGAARQLARAALDYRNIGLAQEALARMESLGAKLVPSIQGGTQVIVNASWKGSSDDLKYLSRIRGILHVGIHGVPLDAAAVRMLGRLRGLQRLELYGTGLSDDAIAGLQRQFPEARIDVRRGGKLGVGGQPLIGPCLINHVEEGSAAAEAGLQIGDVVVEIDGHPVANFEELTAKVGEHGAGDTIDVKIERNNERTTRQVRLGGWR